jgi:uncharacterized Zn-binding protein involved in type VI secretion
MPGFNEAAVASAIAQGAGRVEQISAAGSPLDVWSRTADGIGDNAARTLSDPAGAMRSELDGRLRQMRAALPDRQASQSVGHAVEATVASAGGVMEAAGKIADADGALATVGAVFGTLTSIEQMLSVPFSVIPTPALPALRITDQGIGLPHAHAHPPNLTPPNPVPVPLPSAGPVIPIPFLSGASRVLINGMPAARCGDMGLGIWCGGYFPMYEVFLGSSSVWFEGARAARIGVDITKHCIFTTPKPSDPPVGPMVGTTVSSSPNVSIGGFPLPSLCSLAIGAAFKALFRGLGKVRSLLRAADDVAEEAGEAAGRFRRVGTGARRGEAALTAAQKAELEEYIAKCGAPENVRWVDDVELNTAYGANFDLLNVGSDVMPAPSGLTNLPANSRVSAKGAIAHELIGHREAALAGRSQADDFLEEAQASFRASRHAPDLTPAERATLWEDGMDRLAAGGHNFDDVVDQLWLDRFDGTP